MKDTLIVGYCPVEGSPGDTLGVAFVHTDSGQRLARYCGLLSSRQLLDHFNLVNLYREPDAPFSVAEGSRRAQALWSELIVPRNYRRVVLCSSPVAQAFGLPYHPLFTWYERCHEQPLHGEWRGRCDSRCTTTQVAVIPHPSGLVRWWNDGENVQRARDFLAPLLTMGDT